MKRSLRFAAAAGIGALGLLAFVPAAGAHTVSGSAVYAQTNDPHDNHLLVYSRASNGTLHSAGSWSTHGRGGAESGAAVDPLASQGSVAYDAAHHLLFVTNAGSSQLSVFSAYGTNVDLQQVIGTEGSFPTSVTVHGNDVYVLDAGNEGAVVGYHIDGQHVHRLADSKRMLDLDNTNPPDFLKSPGQVGFTPDGDHLVVTTKAHNTIDVFGVRHDGSLTATPVVNAPAGMVPFAFDFDSAGRLVVVEAGNSDVAVYSISAGGSLTTVSGPVADGQKAACWIAGGDGGWNFVANAGSSSLSSYHVAANGTVTLSPGTTPTSGNPIDLVTSPDGHYLYSENGGAGTIDEFSVGSHGALTRIGTVTGLTAGTIEGLTAA